LKEALQHIHVSSKLTRGSHISCEYIYIYLLRILASPGIGCAYIRWFGKI